MARSPPLNPNPATAKDRRRWGRGPDSGVRRGRRWWQKACARRHWAKAAASLRLGFAKPFC
ncbi:hypothetical protein ES332_D11G397800v1 [Gossypium tomentosum]|uniref:Uncharacterized protein n=1 Tax=Gossypium tomentosum TaxID=34277 RepID=A0A5D2IX57_GOSTO|nr:hypothetical protein ES332_D11G397800v1 [Gossypium tomentosum]